jgi:transcriptional regulator with XRE-family HTH domain
MPEWHCATCDLSVTDEESDEPLQAALRRHVGLLTPQQIKAGIKELGITQEKFAEKIRCAPESISRWLNGAVLQSRVYDCLMRIYFEFPQVRGALDQFSPASSFGESVVHARDLEVIAGSASGWGEIESKLPRISQAYESFFAAATPTVAGYVFSDVRSTGGESAAGRTDSFAVLLKHLYRHAESVDSLSHSTSNRISNFDWSVVYGGGA